MWRLVLSIVTVVLGVAQCNAAEKDAQSLRIITEAVRAAGGRENLSKHASVHAKGEGIAYLNDGSMHALTTEDWTAPGKYRTETRIRSKQFNETEIAIVNGDNAWITRDGVTRGATEQERAVLDFAHRMARWNLLYPLMEEKDVNLQYLGEAKVRDKSVFRIRASVDKKKNQYCDYDFDKSSYLELRTKYPFVDPDNGTDTIMVEEEFGDFRTVERVSVSFAYSLYVSGRLRHKTTTTEFKVLDKVDEKLFEKPK